MQQRPSLYALLRRGDEVFAVVNLLLDKSSLSNSNATFAETLYGLRRVQQESSGVRSSNQSALSPKSQHRTLVMQVIVALEPSISSQALVTQSFSGRFNNKQSGMKSMNIFIVIPGC